MYAESEDQKSAGAVSDPMLGGGNCSRVLCSPTQRDSNTKIYAPKGGCVLGADLNYQYVDLQIYPEDEELSFLPQE